MKIAIGCDHAGFPLKETVLQTVKRLGHEVTDCGTFSCERADYPDYADKVAKLVAAGQVERGILICGSGVGVCVAANKTKGVRACVCHDAYSAKQAVEHDALNVLCLGARIIGTAVAEELTERFLSASFQAGTRHEMRLNKVKTIEDLNFK
ncbi:MAG: ribose 5-phosphate isomerase B [Elusimicrobiaceae bacterium]|uniref:ribose 5-phosphate isomerase B n=1 Tax=Candidatus Avelusimicrobium sp. TaxID=3048833 RepID=UPI001B1BDA5E|nr:ribose 5-phosphate isomerase B [Elusimicrobiaceae bacterium]MBP3513661.1 ribose 5-phosphate isomerase B [Elusimicrobiaceae bacterium]